MAPPVALFEVDVAEPPYVTGEVFPQPHDHVREALSLRIESNALLALFSLSLNVYTVVSIMMIYEEAPRV